MLAVGLDPFVIIAALAGSLLHPFSGSPLTGADGDASEERATSGLLAASDGPFVTFSHLLGGYRLPAELELVGSSVPDMAKAFMSSLLPYAVASKLSLGAGAPS